MSINVPNHAVQKFASNVSLLAQQMHSKLEGTVLSSGGHVGEQVSPVDQWGLIEASENTTRFADMPRVDADATRRWVFPRDFDLAQLVDPKDLLRNLNDPKSALAMAAVAALNRKKDRVLLEALDGTNYVGKAGTTTQALGSGQVVGVNTGGTASKLNVAKIRAAKKILMANDIDLGREEITLVVDSAGYDSLFAEVQVVSKDYNEARDGKPIMVNGVIDSFMGVRIVHSERVFTGTDDQSGTSTSLFMYCKSGAYIGTWQDINTSISVRNDLRGEPVQIYNKMTIGATRIEEAKVVRIWSH